MVVIRDINTTPEPGDTRRQRRGYSVVATGGDRDRVIPPPQGVHRLGKSDSILLGAGRIAALEFQINLTKPDLTLDIARSHQGGIADLGIEYVLIRLQALLK